MLNALLRPLLERLPENNRLERVWVLAKTDFFKRYYGSLLGLVWALVNPLFQLGIYYTVFVLIFGNKQESYILFLFLGLVVFLFFSETATKGLSVVRSKSYLVENLGIRWLDVFLAATLSVFFGFLFNLGVYVLFSLPFGAEMHMQALLLPLLVVQLVAVSMSCQVMLAAIQVHIRDIEHIWDLVKMGLLWLSGIFFDLGASGTAFSKSMLYWNPLAGIVTNFRRILIYGQPLDAELWWRGLFFAVMFTLGAVTAMSKLRRYALEKL
jgi:ABC-type polysaccharide/polyol phosphate export permease